jgi:predicted adenylyl cyclase CyaB
MREVELKSVVDDFALRRSSVESAGGLLIFEGHLIDVRFDTPAADLIRRDHVLRLRVYDRDGERDGHLDWKGETRYEDGYKVREEISTSIGDPDVLAVMMKNLGFQVVREIEREIAQYSLQGAIVRFERYPRMDDLVEVEGTPASIESAISSMGMPRAGFSPRRLADFIVEYEARTGLRAAVSPRELAGVYSFREDAV